LPFTPVPITLQTFAVLLTGALLGSRLGAAALLLYLTEGAVGLPFFRGGNGGWLYLAVSPTAGYLLAYPLAAYVTGRLAERGWDRNFLKAAAAIAIGSLVVLFGGWLGLLRFYPAGQAFALGVAPFIVGDLVKIALAAAALPSGWALLRRKG
ncbi:MAG TPA: biotin transporter BioY, partial [Pyrinomonadaceae bacterium]